MRSLRRAGIRLLRIGMPYPLAGTLLRRFARGLRELVVIEEKASFVETQVRDLLYDDADNPRVLGKRGRDGERLVPADGALTADRLAAPLRSVLGANVELAAPRKRLPLIPNSAHSVFLQRVPPQPLDNSCPTDPWPPAESGVTPWRRSSPVNRRR